MKGDKMKLQDTQGRNLGSYYDNSNFLGTPKDILQRQRNSWIAFNTSGEALEYKYKILKRMAYVRQENIQENHWGNEQEKNFNTLTNWIHKLIIVE